MPRRHSVRLVRFLAPISISVLLAFAVVAGLRVDLASAQELTPGTQARVAADGDTLRLRAGATVSAAIIASIPDGSIVNVRDGSEFADGYTWQRIDWDGAIGWVAAEFLEPLGGTGSEEPTASPTTSPSATPSVTPTNPPTASATGTISGFLPPAGKAGLVVWGGGTMESLVATAAQQGCGVRSIYTVRNGLFVAYTPSAPAFVNASWDAQVGEINSVEALLVYCDAPAQASSNGQSSTGGSPTAAAVDDNRPPGPAGNQ